MGHFSRHARKVWHVYDLSGNLLSKTTSTCPPGYPSFVYDGEDQMTSAPPSGVSYVYDGHGTRVERCLPNCTNPTAWTAYLFSGSRDIAEYDNGAAVSLPSREFVYSGGVPGSGLLASITGGSTITYFHSDHLGWRVSTNASGQVTGQQGDYPYGEPWYSQNGNQFVFTSYSRDTATNLDYAMARYYDSSAGRFGLPDPLSGAPDDPQSWNRYAYVRNDPVDMTDPSGQSLLTDLISFAWGLFFQNHGMGLPGQPPPFGMPGGPSNGTVWNEHPPVALGGGSGFPGGIFGQPNSSQLVIQNFMRQISGTPNTPRWQNYADYLDWLLVLLGPNAQLSTPLRLIQREVRSYNACTSAAGASLARDDQEVSDAADDVAKEYDNPFGGPVEGGGGGEPQIPDSWTHASTNGFLLGRMWARYTYNKAMRACASQNPLVRLVP